ncbi:transmembrane protein 104-like isoform X2 [Corticium candelabrum]|uniref:transmembrane protein 104-like isoform X2 n=1 Tax=Corticium candelabrum TaxID=121492 RepID=UPI002E31F9F1|nr:transmembrane protein 104-like isoform X2 [Corticium candelabrum]
MQLPSFVTSTFMVEAMALGNAWLQISGGSPDSDDESETSVQALVFSQKSDDNFSRRSLLTTSNKQPKNLFTISDRIEMGQLATFFFNRVGIVLYYLCIVVYLYGDLAIYATAIPKALTSVVCGSNGRSTNKTANHTSVNDSRTDNCFGPHTVTKKQAYYIFLLGFTLILGPFVFFNVQKTKYLQIFTSATRYIALVLMVVVSLIDILKNGNRVKPTLFRVTHLPNLFGALVYAFMCQHSLPSMITPIKNKKGLTAMLGFDFIAVTLFYVLIVYTAITRFPPGLIDDEYTNNFHLDTHVTKAYAFDVFSSYFIQLFPVFTLSTNFPIIGVTLRNNLKSLFYREGRKFPFVVDRIVFPLLAVLPPVAVAFATDNLGILVGITGSYAGVGVQYVIPAMLVWCGRRQLATRGVNKINHHESVFSGNVWIVVVCFWSVASWLIVTVNNIVSRL